MSDVNLKYLNECPEIIPDLALHFREAWGYLNPDRTLSDNIRILESRKENVDTIPFTFVFFKENDWVGTISLKDDDLKTRSNLTPWISSLYVKSEFRGQGIGSFLLKSMLKKARGLGVESLYLNTAGVEKYYARKGWILIDEEVYNGTELSIMKYDLA